MDMYNGQLLYAWQFNFYQFIQTINKIKAAIQVIVEKDEEVLNRIKYTYFVTQTFGDSCRITSKKVHLKSETS